MVCRASWLVCYLRHLSKLENATSSYRENFGPRLGQGISELGCMLMAIIRRKTGNKNDGQRNNNEPTDCPKCHDKQSKSLQVLCSVEE